MLLDLVAFGSLLVVTLLDPIPSLAGLPLAVVVGGFAYLTARELVGLLLPNRLESTESFATTYAVIIVGFMYFFRRNDSDLILLVITLALMMGSLMLAIAVIGCMSEKKARSFLQLLVVLFATSVLAGLFGHLAILPTVLPNSGILAAVILLSALWWRLSGARGERETANGEGRPPVRSSTVVAFVSSLLVGWVGVALAVGPLAKNSLLQTGFLRWLVTIAAVIGLVLWESSIRPALARNSQGQPQVVPFIKGRLLDRLVPLAFASTVLFYYYWTPRG